VSSSWFCSVRLRSSALLLVASGVTACDPLDGRGIDDTVPVDAADSPPFDAGVFGTVDSGVFFPFPEGVFPDAGFVPLPPGVMPPRLVTVQSPAVKPPPIYGGTLSVSADEAYLVVADPDRDAVHVIERASHRVRTLTLAAGSRPFRAHVGTDGTAHVVLRGSGALARLTLAEAQLSGSVSVCAEPRGFALAATAQTLAVACASGELVSVDAQSYAVTRRLQLEPDLRDVLARADGGFYVSRFRSAELLQVTPGGVAAGRSDGVRAIGFADAPTLDGTVVPRASVAARRTVAMAGGKTAMLHQNSQDTTVVEQPGGYGGFGCPITTGGLTVFGPDGDAEGYTSLQLSGVNVDVSTSPDNAWIAVASPGGFGNALPTLSIYSNQPQPVAEGVPPPGACNGFPAATDGSDMQFTSVVFGTSGTLYAFSREPASLSEYRLDPTTAQFTLRQRFSLSDTSVRDTGHELFHSDVGGGIACVSCHGEAEDDGHVWNFDPSGPRRTQHLRGGVLGRAPFHWSGDLITMQTLMDEVMTRRMSGFGMDDAHTRALGGWLDAQPALSPSPPEAASVARGKALFDSERVACASCHAGADLSSNAPVDVGTGGQFKVPTLRGIALRPPYMHDGCAKTLRERFEPSCGGTQHGDISQLTSADLDDLLAYLTSL
jgi:Cytochrome c